MDEFVYNFEEIEVLLNQCTFIANTNRIKSLSNKNSKHGYTCPVGLCYDYASTWGVGYREPKFDRINGNHIYYNICKLIDNYCKKNNIDFRFNALTINKNFESKWHKDKGNNGESMVFCLGNFKGGRLVKKINEIDSEYINVYKQPHIFKACEIEHCTEEFTGKRYCIVAYWI